VEPDPIRHEIVEHVATVTLDRPDQLNALNQRATAALIDLLTALDADPAVRAIVLTGAGRGFCAGADVGDLAAAAAGQADDLRPAAMRDVMRNGSARLARLLLELETPMVAAVNGPCAGAGVGLALSCDFVLAAEDAVFSVVFVRRGLVPDYGVTWLLTRLVGLRRAKELALLGERLTAAEADALGLLTRVVPGADLLEEAQALARRLADGPGVALRLAKRLLNDVSDLDHATAVDREFTAQALCFASADALEGATAFLEKREPRFTSR
jgi:2-(1,2-epoxy-1,2-dihydrophenyl)acetyl-CoA isomerase